MRSTRSSGPAGFTLVELMIAVAILAIIAAVALPIYNQYSQRTYRTEAQADLLNCAQGMERYAARNFSYTGAVLANVCDPTSDRYVFNLNVPNANQFTVAATPVGGGVMDGDGCLMYDQAGQRTWDRNCNGAADVGEDNWEE